MSSSEKIGKRSFIKYASATAGLAVLSGLGYYYYYIHEASRPSQAAVRVTGKKLPLPPPSKKSEVSLEEALLKRRSIRDYTDEPLTLQEVGQLLWAAQGITEPRWGGRTAPSGGPIYPLEIYVVADDKGVTNLDAGVYHYIPQDHSLDMTLAGSAVRDLAVAALDQDWVYNAKISIVIAAAYHRTTERYGDRGVRYVHLEAGHAGQNIYLQAAALNLGTLVLGAFIDDQVKSVLNLPDEEDPIYIVPVGHPSKLSEPPRGPA